MRTERVLEFLGLGLESQDSDGAQQTYIVSTSKLANTRMVYAATCSALYQLPGSTGKTSIRVILDQIGSLKRNTTPREDAYSQVHDETTKKPPPHNSSA